jgi:hypothetical protein
MESWFQPWRGAAAFSSEKLRRSAPSLGRTKRNMHDGMLDSERIMLSAVEKWTKYGRFPYKLIFHSTILMMLAVQLLSILVQFTEPVSSGENLFAHLFLDKDTAADNLMIFTVDEMLERTVKIVRTYYDINDQTVFYYTPEMDEEGDPKPMEMIVAYHTDYDVDAALTVEEVYYLNDTMPLGPLNGSSLDEVKNFLNHSQTITFRFVLFDDVAATQFGPAPMVWTIDLVFTNTGGIFSAELWTVRHIRNNVFLHKLGFIPATIIILSLVSLFLGIKAIYSTIKVMRRTKAAWKSVPQRHLERAWKDVKAEGVMPIYIWSDIPLSVKMDFFSSWNLMECVGEICLVIGCILGFVFDHGLPVSDEARLFIGAGSMIICINFIKYLEYWKKFSALVMTLQVSFLRNLRFVISVFPLYMGFVVCGYVMFSPYSPYFASIDTTTVTLFALINGDDTHAIFGNLRENYPYPRLSEAYLFAFDMLFITLVLNVFLYIIEDAYQASAVWINGAAEKLSRSHRHMRADVPLPAKWRPRPGSVEFDIPVLFRVLERAQQLNELECELASPNRSPSSESLENIPSYDNSFSMEPESPSESRTEPQAIDYDVSTPSALQAAIEQAVAHSQESFQKQVELTIKVMQEEYSTRLQEQVRALIQKSNFTVHHPDPVSPNL